MTLNELFARFDKLAAVRMQSMFLYFYSNILSFYIFEKLCLRVIAIHPRQILKFNVNGLINVNITVHTNNLPFPSTRIERCYSISKDNTNKTWLVQARSCVILGVKLMKTSSVMLICDITFEDRQA